MTSLVDSHCNIENADNRCDELRRFLINGISTLWTHSQTPIWVSDCTGRIVYANPAALQTRDLQLNGIAARQLAFTAGNSHMGSSDGEQIEISPLLDGHGRRLGWLALGHTPS